MRKFGKFVCLCLIVIPAVLISIQVMRYRMEDRVQADVAHRIEACAMVPEEHFFFDDTGREQPVPTENTILSPYIEERDWIDFTKLQEMNRDIVGVIRIGASKIDYPVLQSEVADYYIDRDIYREPSMYGSIYMEELCTIDSRNILLYGHSMRNGAMFGSIRQYERSDYRDGHAVIRFITPGMIRLYEVSSLMAADADDEALLDCLFLSLDEHYEALSQAQKRNGAVLYEEIVPGAEYISLVTCEYTHDDGRYILMGRKLGEFHYQ